MLIYYRMLLPTFIHASPILIHALPILIHWLGFRLSDRYLNTLTTRQPIRIEHPRTLGSQSESSISSSESSANLLRAPSAPGNQSESSTREASAANQNQVFRHPSRQPIRSEHRRLSATNQNRLLCHPVRQPIRIEYYVTRVVITSSESSRLGWKTLLGSRLESARYSLS